MIQALAGLLDVLDDFGSIDPFDLLVIGAAVLAALSSSLIVVLGLWRPAS